MLKSNVAKSYSAVLKETLADITKKKKCCRRTEADLTDALNRFDYSEALKVSDRFYCSDCASSFLRVIFLFFGTVTDPNKSFHLELSFPDEELCNRCLEILRSIGFSPLNGKRREKWILYLKSGESISDFIGLIGAQSMSFDIINLRLYKEERENVNRIINFETANIKKSVEAKKSYITAINYLIDNGLYESMPEDLKMTAFLCLEYDTLSLEALGRMHSPTISKSGVKHRLDKILQLYQSHFTD